MQPRSFNLKQYKNLIYKLDPIVLQNMDGRFWLNKFAAFGCQKVNFLLALLLKIAVNYIAYFFKWCKRDENNELNFQFCKFYSTVPGAIV